MRKVLAPKMASSRQTSWIKTSHNVFYTMKEEVYRLTQAPLAQLAGSVQKWGVAQEALRTDKLRLTDILRLNHAAGTAFIT